MNGPVDLVLVDWIPHRSNGQQTGLRGYATVALAGGLVIHGIKLRHDAERGLAWAVP